MRSRSFGHGAGFAFGFVVGWGVLSWVLDDFNLGHIIGVGCVAFISSSSGWRDGYKAGRKEVADALLPGLEKIRDITTRRSE